MFGYRMLRMFECYTVNKQVHDRTIIMRTLAISQQINNVHAMIINTCDYMSTYSLKQAPYGARTIANINSENHVPSY